LKCELAERQTDKEVTYLPNNLYAESCISEELEKLCRRNCYRYVFIGIALKWVILT